MKKICFFINDISGKGGTERVSFLIANELSKYYEVEFFSIIGDIPFFPINNNVKINSLKLEKIEFFSIVKSIRGYLKREKIDILIEVDSILRIFSFFACLGLKNEIFTWEHFNYYSPKGIKKRWLARWLAGKFSDKIITLTKEDREFYIKELKINRKKVINIYNPVSFEKVNVLKNRKSKVCIAVGRLCKQKGFDRLIEIWSKAETFGWKLKIIGSGEDEGTLRELIKEKRVKNIELIENTNKITNYYEEGELYLMTSRYEGLPLVLIEAQSFGIPIISYDVKTGPKDIVNNGINGYLVSDNNEIEFIKKLNELIQDKEKRDKFSKSSLNNVRKFKKEAIINEWKKMIEENLKEKKVGGKKWKIFMFK